MEATEQKLPLNHRVKETTRNEFDTAFAALNLKAVKDSTNITKEEFLEALIMEFSKKVTLENVLKQQD